MNSQDKIIYIFCPANLETGGPDALHQLRYYMEKVNLTAYIVYFNTTVGINPTADRYKIYEPKIKKLEDIEDNENNLLIAPESSSILLNNCKRIKKCIWWLSVYYYDNPPLKRFQRFKNRIKKVVGMYEDPNRFNFSIKDCLNLCGSKYTYEFLKKQGVRNAQYLVEPISKVFLDYKETDELQRDNVILYNPGKPSEIMTRLLESNEFEFNALKGYSVSELIDVYRKAKLYIDFGNFGGPERMPKEAVYFGCTILVGKRNAARNNFDVAILNKYKIKKYNDLDLVKQKIYYMLDNYETNIGDFEFFREKIKNMESNFVKQIEDIFISND